MACIPAIPATCAVTAGVSGVTNAVAGSATDALAVSMKDGATWVIRTSVGWWIDMAPIFLPTSPVDTIRGYVIWLAAAVATAGVIWQGILLAVSRRPEPALTVGKGLFTVALWSAIGVVGPTAALLASDKFASWVLGEAAGGKAADRLVAIASLDPVDSPGAIIVLALIVMLTGIVQAFLMMFREGTIIILAGVIVLAASGQFTGATRTWLPKVLGWMVALICYKPAALVYASALTFMGDTADVRTVFVGIAMMIVAIVALPVLLKLFTWTTGSIASGSSGAGMAAMAGVGAAAIQGGTLMTRSAGSSSAAQAANIRTDLGPMSSGGGAPSGAATSTPPVAAPTGSAAPSAAAGTGAAAASSGGGAASGAAAAGGVGAAAGPAVAVGTTVVAAGAKVVGDAGKAAGSAMTQEG